MASVDNCEMTDNRHSCDQIETDLRYRIHNLTIDMNNCQMLESKNEIQRLIAANISILNMFLAKKVRDQHKPSQVTDIDNQIVPLNLVKRESDTSLLRSTLESDKLDNPKLE